MIDDPTRRAPYPPPAPQTWAGDWPPASEAGRAAMQPGVWTSKAPPRSTSAATGNPPIWAAPAPRADDDRP